jgi:transposase
MEMTVEKKTRKTYDKEFKRNALELFSQGQKTQSELEKDMGIALGSLARWKRDLATEGLSAFRGQGRIRPFEEEAQRLRKELQLVTQEREILKKAMGVIWREKP